MLLEKNIRNDLSELSVLYNGTCHYNCSICWG